MPYSPVAGVWNLLIRKFTSALVDTPILLIAWRRPHTLRKVIDAIRPVAPTRLFIACDGPNPNRPGEVEAVQATRNVVEDELNWPCQINRLYSDVNQGCRQGVSRAISWFFEHVEEGIILEDDCIPHPSFFPYCSSLLQLYRDDTRVWCISGNNFQDGQRHGNASYYFSRIPLIWGWATWRRCWNQYDIDISLWPAFRDSGLMKTVFTDPVELIYWSNIWQWLYYNGQPNTWDYQWCFLCVSNGGLSIEPNQNLVSNIGFGDAATHTTGDEAKTTPAQDLGPLVHPQFVLFNAEAAEYTFEHKFCGKLMRRDFKLLPRIKVRALRSIKRLLAIF